jgi:hypothetical protein
MINLSVLFLNPCNYFSLFLNLAFFIVCSFFLLFLYQSTSLENLSSDKFAKAMTKNNYEMLTGKKSDVSRQKYVINEICR